MHLVVALRIPSFSGEWLAGLGVDISSDNECGLGVEMNSDAECGVRGVHGVSGVRGSGEANL